MQKILQHRERCNFPRGENATREKMFSELDELNEETHNPYSQAFEEEFADLIISGYGFFKSIGKDLEDIIDKKISKNEKKYL